MWRACIIAFVALVVASLPTAHAQMTIIPQSKINQVANPTTAHSELMEFANEGVIEVGTISEDQTEWNGQIEWKNVGNKPIAITRIQTTCSCVNSKFDKRPTNAGEQSSIEVKFVPKGRLGGVEQRLFVYTTLSDKYPTAIIQLRGRVTPSADKSGNYHHSCGTLLLMQTQVSFDAEGMQCAEIAVMNGGSTPLTITHDQRLSHPALRANTEPTTLAPGQEGNLVISYNPSNKAAIPPLLYLKGINTSPRERQIKVVIKQPTN